MRMITHSDENSFMEAMWRINIKLRSMLYKTEKYVHVIQLFSIKLHVT